MSFFRRTLSRTRDKKEPAPAPQRYLSAGRETASTDKQQQQQQPQYDDLSSPRSPNAGGSLGPYQQQEPRQHQYQQHDHYAHYNDSTISPRGGAFDPDGDGDFDDAASYHSISSNPAASRSAAKYQGENDYAQAMPSRYQYMASQGRSAARAMGPEIDSYYSTAGDLRSSLRVTTNVTQEENPTPASLHGGRPLDRQAHGPQSAKSTWSPDAHSPTATSIRGGSLGRSSAMQQRRQDANPKTVQEMGDEYFQKAVNYHEEGNLVSATAYFKKAADAHNPLGMLFYGLSLRHGWGCQPNEKIAFLYLQKAGELVIPNVKDMNPAVAGMAKEELAMAIYELGQSYRHGWGVSRNKKTAAYYFEIAAELGDADAQAELAACYESGDGVKRDMKKAAHYFRLAHKQGHEIFGNSWIFKKKYDSD
ncbi:HCP-like protein [Martensiomyces pterosporus]|nr:HCP-like protein [Martensiomyces pterosporus]